MALTLAEAAKLSNDIILQGVIETIVQDSPILRALPFIEITGNGLTYNRENTNPSATFFDVGDTWTEATPTFTQITAALKIIGGDADIDNFLLTTRSNVQDLQAAIVRLKAKAVQTKFEDTFVNGDTAVDVKSFDGIDKLTTGGQAISMGANGATLTLAKLDELIDLVKQGSPDMLLMSKRTRRTLNSLARATSFLETERTEFGTMMQFYDGVPIGVSDYISDAVATLGPSDDEDATAVGGIEPALPHRARNARVARPRDLGRRARHRRGARALHRAGSVVRQDAGVRRRTRRGCGAQCRAAATRHRRLRAGAGGGRAVLRRRDALGSGCWHRDAHRGRGRGVRRVDRESPGRRVADSGRRGLLHRARARCRRRRRDRVDGRRLIAGQMSTDW